MAVVEFPEATVVLFSHTSDPGLQAVYQNPDTPDEFVVGSGWTLLAGNITLGAANEDESNALIAFHDQLNGLDNDVMLPWYRERNGAGVFPFRTALTATSIADATADDESTLSVSFALPSGFTLADVNAKKNRFLQVQNRLVRLTADATTEAGKITATITPRLEATTSGIQIAEAQVRARLDGRVPLVMTDPDIVSPITYAWTERTDG